MRLGGGLASLVELLNALYFNLHRKGGKIAMIGLAKVKCTNNI